MDCQVLVPSLPDPANCFGSGTGSATFDQSLAAAAHMLTLLWQQRLIDDERTFRALLYRYRLAPLRVQIAEHLRFQQS